MSAKKASKSNTSQNLILRGFNSIQIGLYLLVFAFVLKSLLDGFLSDTSMLGMMSIQIIEGVGLVLTILFVVLSGFAVFFSNRRKLKKMETSLWNKASKKQALYYFGLSSILIAILVLLKTLGFSVSLGIAFLLSVGVALIALNLQQKKSLYLIAALAIGLAALSFIIPTYWYSSLLIVGASFIVYGIIVKKE